MMGHLAGDWLLQNDWMATGKKEGLFRPAGLVHFMIYTATILSAFWLSGVRGKQTAFYAALGTIVFLSHWLIDSTRLVERWMRFYRQSDLAVVRMMVDQTLHLLVLAVLAALS
jgi:hypothetical protein